MFLFTRLRTSLTAFRRDDRAAATVFSLFLVMSFVAMGGVAVDVTNVMAKRTELQITADAVAHAAIVTRETRSEAEAKTAAANLALANITQAEAGIVVKEEDIIFGTFDPVAVKFTPVPGSRSAVLVIAREATENSNPIGTFMLNMVGFDEWNVDVISIFASNNNTCISEGFVAQDTVDLQSNNKYRKGFCVHSNTGVKVSSGNWFEKGSIISMPSSNMLQMPQSGWTSNVGLRDALTYGTLNIRIVNRIATVIAGIQDPNSKFWQPYITSPTVITLTNRTIAANHLTQGRIHRLTCNGNQDMRFSGGFTLRNVIIVTNCPVSFNQGVTLESSIIATTNTSKQSMTSAAAFTLGRSDVCVPGGESQLVTMGSIKLTSKISIYGSQMLAAGDISFTSLGEGSRGVSLTAGGTLSGTTNMDMEACGNMAGTNLQMSYFKMAY